MHLSLAWLIYLLLRQCTGREYFAFEKIIKDKPKNEILSLKGDFAPLKLLLGLVAAAVIVS